MSGLKKYTNQPLYTEVVSVRVTKEQKDWIGKKGLNPSKIFRDILKKLMRQHK